MASIQFSIPPLLERFFARKNVPAWMLVQLTEQQEPDQAARVIYALRLGDPQITLDALVNRAAQAMGKPIGVVERLEAVPIEALPRLYLIRDSLESGDVEIGFRGSDRAIASSIISRQGEGSRRNVLEFGKL